MTAKRTKSQIGRYARTKGARFEREVAEALKPVFPDARRGIGQTRCAGEVPDVDGLPVWLEAKFRQEVNILKAMDQAEAAERVCRAKYARPARHAIVVWRKLRARSLNVACRLSLLIQLAQGVELDPTVGPPTMVYLDFNDWLAMVVDWQNQLAYQSTRQENRGTSKRYARPAA